MLSMTAGRIFWFTANKFGIWLKESFKVRFIVGGQKFQSPFTGEDLRCKSFLSPCTFDLYARATVNMWLYGVVHNLPCIPPVSSMGCFLPCRTDFVSSLAPKTTPLGFIVGNGQSKGTGHTHSWRVGISSLEVLWPTKLSKKVACNGKIHSHNNQISFPSIVMDFIKWPVLPPVVWVWQETSSNCTILHTILHLMVRNESFIDGQLYIYIYIYIYTTLNGHLTQDDSSFFNFVLGFTEFAVCNSNYNTNVSIVSKRKITISVCANCACVWVYGHGIFDLYMCAFFVRNLCNLWTCATIPIRTINYKDSCRVVCEHFFHGPNSFCVFCHHRK